MDYYPRSSVDPILSSILAAITLVVVIMFLNDFLSSTISAPKDIAVITQEESKVSPSNMRESEAEKPKDQDKKRTQNTLPEAPNMGKPTQKRSNEPTARLSSAIPQENVNSESVEIDSLKSKEKDLGPPVSLKPIGLARRISFRNHSFDTYTLNIQDAYVGFYWKPAGNQRFGSFQELKDWLSPKGQELVFATNAGIFNPDFNPTGLFIAGGNIQVALEEGEGRGNFYLKPNGVFLLGDAGAAILNTPEYSSYPHKVQQATQSGPLLLYKGKVHPAFTKGSTNTFIRSGVGILSPSRIVFAISNEPVNFYDFALLFKEQFSCQDALYLDGAISKMFAPDLGRYENLGDFAGIIGVSRPKVPLQ